MIGRIALLISALWSLTVTAQEAPRSALTVLVDLSGTWLSSSSTAENRRVLQVVGNAIPQLPQVYATPIHIRYLPIGDSSFLRAPLCEAVFAPKLIGSSVKKDRELSRPGEIKRYFAEECVEVLLRRKPERYTDIVGAIEGAVHLTASIEGNQKAIVVLSDLVADNRPGAVHSMPSLKGTHVIAMYRVLANDRQRTDLFDKRIADWKSAFAGAQARQVDMMPDGGLTTNQLLRLLSR